MTEPLDADLRCFHGTDEQPICDECVREVLAGVVESRDRLAAENKELRRRLAFDEDRP